MRKYFLFLIIIFNVPALFAQDITGLWKGTLYNDTTGMYYKYEIGISKEKGKFTGFSHTWFILNDTQYFGLKKVKIRKDGNKYIIEDDGLIANNYPVTPPKNIRQLNVLELEIRDSIMFLRGPFSTNRTRDYHSLTGYIDVQRRNDFWQSSLVPHLQELSLERSLSFVREEQDELATAEARAVLRNGTTTAVPIASATPAKPGEIAAPPRKPVLPELSREEILKRNDSLILTARRTGVLQGKVIMPAVKTERNTSLPDRNAPAIEVDLRTTELQHVVSFSSDSLQLSLYDNGQVDGDTVSVLMNGEVILAKQRLSTEAVRKTIHLPAGMDSLWLTMYAENLGTIAPNTGLLVIRDGKSIYEVRFSGDLQRNAAILFRRKKP